MAVMGGIRERKQQVYFHEVVLRSKKGTKEFMYQSGLFHGQFINIFKPNIIFNLTKYLEMKNIYFFNQKKHILSEWISFLTNEYILSILYIREFPSLKWTFIWFKNTHKPYV